MKTTVAIAMGFISGLVIYFTAAMMFMDVGTESSGPSGLFVAVTLFGGWAVTTWLLLRGSRTTNMVIRRGFLVGAAEWLVMAFAGVVFSGRAVTSATASGPASEATTAGAVIGGGMIAAFTGAVSVFMAVVCLIGFAIAYFMGREMRDTTALPTRKCPECAEMIQADARKCRYCGAALVTSPAAPV